MMKMESRESPASLKILAFKYFASRFTLGFVVIFGLVVFAILFAQKIEYEKISDESARALAKTLVAHLEHYDIAAIQIEIDSYQQLWDTQKILVVDAYSSTMGFVGSVSPQQAPEFNMSLYTSEGKGLGELSIWLTKYNIVKTKNLISWLSIFLLSMSLLLFGVYLLLHTLRRFVEDPLEYLFLNKGSSELLNVSLLQTRSSSLEIERLYKNWIEVNDSLLINQESIKESGLFTANLQKAFLNVLSASDHTFVLVDAHGIVQGKSIKDPFSAKDLAQLVEITQGKISIQDGFEGLGYDCKENAIFGQYTIGSSVDIFTDDGTVLRAQIISFDDGHTLLAVMYTSRKNWPELLLDSYLNDIKVGMVVFNNEGVLCYKHGLNVQNLIEAESVAKEINFGELVLELPKINITNTKSTVTFEHSTKKNKIYRTCLYKNSHGWICVIFNEITKEKEAQSNALEAQRLQELELIANGVSHDFNNVLTVITGQLELAHSNLSDADNSIGECLNIALNAARQSSVVVRQLSTFARRQSLGPKIVYIDQFIRKNLSIFNSSLSGNTTIKLNLASESAVFIDAENLTSVLLNLVLNARDAMNDKGEITISTGHTLRQPFLKMVSIRIQDTGPGIEKKYLEKIFDPFFTTKAQGKGSGLGLPTARDFVEKSGGEIKVENNAAGACFNVLLPEIESDVENDEILHVNNGVAIDDEGKVINILLVDDDHDTLKTLSGLIKSFGFNVFAYTSANEAYEFCHGVVDIKCAILDLNMPEVSGIEFSTQLRQLHCAFPIILCSGSLDSDVINAAKEAGIQWFLKKPSSGNQVFECVNNAIHHQHN